ncbi:response regulator [Ponticaulis profundi]|uniref:Response regulator n=1 Tax=Ponticaulis profundi TaxID=2665222 RepID=A0ABW1SDW7_9PROT
MDVLIVDDNPADRRLLKMVFKNVSDELTIHACSGGKQALDFLLRQGEHADAPRPQVCLLDINMPGMNGFDVLIAMKADWRLKAIPVFMFSSSDNDGDIQICYENHANGYIQKPMELVELENIARSLSNFCVNILRHAPPAVHLN